MTTSIPARVGGINRLDAVIQAAGSYAARFAAPSDGLTLHTAIKAARALPIRFSRHVSRVPYDDRGAIREQWERHCQEAQEAVDLAMDTPYQMEFDYALSVVRRHRGLFEAAETAERLAGIPREDLELLQADDDELRDMAARLAKAGTETYQAALTLGVLPEATMTELRKLACPRARLRRLRTRRDHTEAWVGWRMGLTGDPKEGFSRWVSPEQLERRVRTEYAQAEYMRQHYLEEEELGLQICLDDLARRGAKGRLARAYAIALAMGALEERHGLTFLMVTVTNPGAWSPVVKAGRTSAYNGASPAEAGRHLKRAVWARIRQALSKRVRTCVGFTVTEPQLTGSPHIHALLLTDQPELVRAIFEGAADSSAQMDVKTWEQRPNQGEAGSASLATYLLKYLTKGQGLLEQDELAKEAETTLDAVAFRAWRRGLSTRTTSYMGLGRGFLMRWEAVFRQGVTDEDAPPPADPAFQRAKAAMLSAQACVTEARRLKAAGDLPGAKAATLASGEHWADALTVVGRLDALPDLAAGPEERACWERVTEAAESAYGEARSVTVGFAMADGGELRLTSGEWTLKRYAQAGAVWAANLETAEEREERLAGAAMAFNVEHGLDAEPEPRPEAWFDADGAPMSHEAALRELAREAAAAQFALAEAAAREARRKGHAAHLFQTTQEGTRPGRAPTYEASPTLPGCGSSPWGATAHPPAAPVETDARTPEPGGAAGGAEPTGHGSRLAGPTPPGLSSSTPTAEADCGHDDEQARPRALPRKQVRWPATVAPDTIRGRALAAVIGATYYDGVSLTA